MSQWIKGPICGIDNCSSRLYRHTDGLTICQYGHVMEGNLETNFEEDENFVPTRRLNLQVRDGAFTVLHRHDRDRQEKTKNVYGEEARVLYLRCLQVLLRHQLKSCSKLFFYERDELDVVGKLYWLKRLNEYEKDKSNMPNALDTISISYLAMVTLKKGPVYTADIIRALRFNDIPFIRSLNLIPKSFLEQLPSFYFKSLEPYQLPLQGELYQRVLFNHKITCDDVSISLPLSYFYPWTLQMLAKELLLPSVPEIFFIFFNLASQVSSNFKISSENNVSIFPDVLVSALHIMSIKIYLIYFNGLDHKKWLDILNRRDLNTQFSFADKEIDFKELLDWSDAKTDKYCQWVYNNLIPEDDDLSMMQKRLFKIFDCDDLSKEHADMNTSKKYGDSQATYAGLAEVAAHLNKSHIDVKEINKIEHILQTNYSEVLGLPKSILNNTNKFLESSIKQKFTL